MSNNQEDLYKILGVSENASDEEIKKAYKKLAVRWHPDKNQDNREEAEKKFKEISHAFSVLKDKQQKQEYDAMRKGGFSNGNGTRFSNFSDFDFGSHDMGFDFYDKMFKDFFKSSKFGDFSAFDNDDDGFFGNFSSNFGGVGSCSTKTVTTIINGKKVTKTEKTYVDKDGKKVTEITESDGSGSTTKKMISNGNSNNNDFRENSNQISNFHGINDDDDFGFGMGGGFFNDPFFSKKSSSNGYSKKKK
jgi:DnaJ-class molecular chaperone